MGGRLTTVTRGMFIIQTDNAFERPTRELLEMFQKIPVEQLTTFGRNDLGLPASEEEKFHAEEEFLGDADPGSYFPPSAVIPNSVGKREILHSGCIQALRVALFKNPDAPEDERVERDIPLPIVSYWIAGGPRFEVYVALSYTENEVHMLIMTPDPKKHREIPRVGRRENIWAIGTKPLIDDLHGRFPEDYDVPEPFELIGAWCQQVSSY